MQPAYRDFGRFGTIGLEIALSIFLGMFIGYWIDEKIGVMGPFLAIGFALGLAAAIKAVMRVMKELDDISAREDARIRALRRGKRVDDTSDKS